MKNHDPYLRHRSIDYFGGVAAVRKTAGFYLWYFSKMLLLLKILLRVFQVLIKIESYRKYLINISMVKWSDTWYVKLELQQIWKVCKEE